MRHIRSASNSILYDPLTVKRTLQITNFGAPKDREVNPNVSSDPCSSNRSNHHSKPAVQHGDLRADPVEVELPPDLEDGRKGGDSGGLGSLSYRYGPMFFSPLRPDQLTHQPQLARPDMTDVEQ